MLKIKDDVDLKELGFEKEDDDFIYQDDVGLCCQDDRIIYFGNISGFHIDQDNHLDRLYDLIQAGLVEKVEE
ncbi:MAG: hypothetical protein IJ223_06735 [Clostridia bacterium]|nr:hypothetical protein [Clostridia bacterium]